MQTADVSAIKVVNSNTLKIIAILSMFIDHLSVWLVPSGTSLDILLHTIGRLAAPIICYLIAEGFAHTSNLKKIYDTAFSFFLSLSFSICALLRSILVARDQCDLGFAHGADCTVYL
ncbi:MULTISPECIES: TraX family protein [unclassified Paenibacillus]|nr:MULTISPECIES: TraX family protein [unclassified Paenibacillus]MDH6373114.1 hypothetical protein [Paenibacillus sp. PastF-3]